MPEPNNMSDHDLLERYQQTNGAPGNLIAAALLAEIYRRGLDL